MKKTKKRTKRKNRYAEEFKRKIAKAYLDGEASYAVLAEDYGLQGKGVVREFVRWYRRKSELSSTKDSIMSEKKPLKDTSTEPDQAAKIKELERRLRLSELQVEALETMIDIAEEELQIDIRKKSGAKPSKK